jgi:hypothetical protein
MQRDVYGGRYMIAEVGQQFSIGIAQADFQARSL